MPGRRYPYRRNLSRAGVVDARPTMALAVSDIGRAVLAFTREAPFSATTQPTVAVSKRPHGGTWSVPADLPGDTAGDPRVAVEGGKAVVAATQVRSRGDAGIFGNPVVAFVAPTACRRCRSGRASPTPSGRSGRALWCRSHAGEDDIASARALLARLEPGDARAAGPRAQLRRLDRMFSAWRQPAATAASRSSRPRW